MVEWDLEYLGEAFWARVIAIAAEEAGELERSEVDAEHLLLAATRPELDGPATFAAVGLDARKVRDFAMFLSGVNEAIAAGMHERPYRRTAKYRRDVVPAVGATIEAHRHLGEAASEAERLGQSPGAAHLLVALRGFLVGFGVRGNDVRRSLGISPVDTQPEPLPRLARPQGVGPLLLGGGGEEVAAEVIAHLGLSDPAVVYVGAGDPDHRGSGWMGDSWERAGHRVVDAGLYEPEDAWNEDALAALRSADVVLLGCAQLGALTRTLAGTPALDELIAASDRGALIVGSSSTSMELGAAAIDPYRDDGPALAPTLGWLDSVLVSPHHRGTNDELDNLRDWIWPLSNLPVLLVPHRGAVLVTPGWTTFDVLDPGEGNRGAWWWTEPNTEPQPVG